MPLTLADDPSCASDSLISPSMTGGQIARRLIPQSSSVPQPTWLEALRSCGLSCPGHLRYYCLLRLPLSASPFRRITAYGPRLCPFPGSTSDQTVIKTVKDDLGSWNLNRVIWVLDRGFTSEENRRHLQRAGGHYIVGEKLRSDQAETTAALSRRSRYRAVAGNLRG